MRLKHRLKIVFSVMLIVLISSTLLNEVNIGVQAQSEPTPTFYAPFDGNYNATTSDGKTVAAQNTENSYLTYANLGNNWDVGINGSALNMTYQPGYGGPDLQYVNPILNNYFSRTQGTIEFWLKPNWNMDQEQENGYTWPFSMGNYIEDTLEQQPCTFSVLLYGGYLTFFTYDSSFIPDPTNTDGTNGTNVNVNYWNNGEWHQVAFSWIYDPTGQNLTFTPYIDGEPWPEINATGWDPGVSGTVDDMVICRRNTDAALDEFKIFNVVLDGDTIKADYLNLCPVDCHAQETVFYTGVLKQNVHVTIKNDYEGTIFGSFGIRVRGGAGSSTGLIHLVEGGSVDLTVGFYPIQVGEYYLDCHFAPVTTPSGPQEERRTIRLFAIPHGEQPSKSESDELAFGDGIYIDCVSNKVNMTGVTNGVLPYYYTPGTCVGNYPGGYSYRMTGPVRGDRFGYLFDIPTDELNKPFLVEVNYVALIYTSPIYQNITMEIDILEPGHPAIQTGVYTGDEYPCNWVNENIYKTQRMIFWPCSEDNVISIVNRWKGHYADAVNITIVPIQGDDANGWFPKTTPVTPTDGGRLLGLWYEEPQIPVDFGAPNNTITGFYVALKHMIDYMHYTGQNLLSYPIYFYDDPIYPSRLEGWPVYGEKGIMHPDNWFELMLKMCALNGISVIGDLMISTIPSLQENIPWEWGPSEWPVDTYKVAGSGGVTALESMTRELVQEVVHDYGGCSALIDLSIRVFESYFPWPINTLLKRISNNDRNFSELLWGTDYPGGNILSQLSSNQKLIFPGFIPESKAANLTKDANNLDSLYAGAGIPFNGYQGSDDVRDNSQIMFQRVLEFSWYRQTEADGSSGQWITRDYYLGGLGNPYSGNCYYYFTGTNENSAAVMYNAYWEPGKGSAAFPWPSANTVGLWTSTWATEFGDELSGEYWRYPAITPGYRYFMQDYSLAMANIDPLYIGNGGSTVGTVGHDVRIGDLPSDNNPGCEDTVELYGLPIQTFAKAYRALPAETFTTFASAIYTTVVRESPDNKYFYIQSQDSRREKVTLTFNQKSDFSLVDLGASSPGLLLEMLVHQGTCTFELDPYELESFSTGGTGAKVTGEKVMTETVLQNDNAVVDVTPFKTVVGQGLTTNINVTAAVGVPAEPVNITLCANQTIIGTLTNVTLAYGNCTTITFTWNTTGFAYGNYTLDAYASPVSGETDTADNNCTGGWVCVSIIGDITGGTPNLLDFVPDGKVDMKDVGVVARCFGQNVPAAPSNCDITGPTQGVPDGKVDMRDIGLVARNWGRHYP